ncbi:MAG: polysaccharide deacetylase family protein [Patescibacteria group bacterium]
MKYLDFSRLKVLRVTVIAILLFCGSYAFLFIRESLSQFTDGMILDSKETAAYGFYAAKLAYAENDMLGSLARIFSNRSTVENVVVTGTAESVPVLLYHGLVDIPDGENITKTNFEAQMFALKQAGWKTISVEDFNSFVKGEKTLPNKSFLLTFDDGAKSSYYPVDPILRALDYNAVTFIISGHSLTDSDRKSSYYLNANELRAMKRSGRWEIQAHADSGHVFQSISINGEQGHYYTNKLWLKELGRLETDDEYEQRIGHDISLVKEKIERVLDIASVSFAFPYGDFAQNITNYPEAQRVLLNSVKDNYDLAFFQTYPSAGFTQNYFDDNTFLVKRIDVGGAWTDADLLRVLNAGRSKEIPLHIYDFSLNEEWIKEWGNIGLKNSSLVLRAGEKTTGAAVVLDGTRNWENYHLKALIDWTRGESLSLVARYKDSKNFTSCNVSGRFIRIDESINGERKKIAETSIDQNFSWDNATFELSVHKNTIKCFIDGEELLSVDSLDSSLDRGGIGFKVWDPVENNSEVIVNQLIVEKLL